MSAHWELYLAAYLAIGGVVVWAFWPSQNRDLAKSVQLVSALAIALVWPLVAVCTVWLLMIHVADRRSGRGRRP